MGEVAVSGEEGNGMAAAAVDAAEGSKKMVVLNNGDVSAAASSSAAAAASAWAAVRWESFLPKMVLRVLLVEADDSTRQIIAALLRKCSYRVAAVPDGLKAWEVLKGRPHNVDLILTEVDLPAISGFALLTLIMEHEICKNIPVIMMSSQDSVSTVYKCMLRGAADFLVKPVRKNELRNLWQHVWRRQASSSGGAGPQDESTAQHKVEATAENNAISNNSSDMACIQKNREYLEKGSDAQSSCTKPELDAERSETECVQGLPHSKWSKLQSSHMDAEKEESHPVLNKQVQPLDYEAEGGSREATTGLDAQRMTSVDDKKSGVHWDFSHAPFLNPESNYANNDSVREVIDLIGAFDNYLKCTHGNNGLNVVANKDEPLPQLDLSLRRHPSGSVNQITDERHRLNHSDASAFSRYVNRNSQPQHSTSPTSCNQQKDQKSHSRNQLSCHTDICDSHLAITQPGESESRNPCPQQRLLPAPVPVRSVRLDNISNGYNSLIPQLFRTQSGPSAMQSSGSVNRQEASLQVNAFYQLNHRTAGNSQQYHGLIIQNSSDMTDQNENMERHKLETVEDRGHISSPTDQSANSSFCNGTVNHFHNLHGASNEKVDSVPVMSTADCGSEEQFQVPDGSSLRTMQREAALTKFRLKRKERCFEKKVRYESRKKLAEKRPRVKGQFVRQVLTESPPGNSPAG